MYKVLLVDDEALIREAISEEHPLEGTGVRAYGDLQERQGKQSNGWIRKKQIWS